MASILQLPITKIGMQLHLAGSIDNLSAVEGQKPSRLRKSPLEANQRTDSPNGRIHDRIKGLEIIPHLLFPNIQDIIRCGGSLGGKDSTLSMLVNDLSVGIDDKTSVKEAVLDDLRLDGLGLGDDIHPPLACLFSQHIGFRAGYGDGDVPADFDMVESGMLIVETL